MVTDQLKRQWLCIVCFANCIRQPERKFSRPSYNRDLADMVATEHLSNFVFGCGCVGGLVGRRGTVLPPSLQNSRAELIGSVAIFSHCKSILTHNMTCS